VLARKHSTTGTTCSQPFCCISVTLSGWPWTWDPAASASQVAEITDLYTLAPPLDWVYVLSLALPFVAT
jgi:hypothetical protein